jgi:alpha-L-rhamnosidase
MRPSKVFFQSISVVMGCLVAAMTALAATGQAGPAGLRVDDLTNPLGIDDATPQMSWQLKDAARGARQTAYEVMVASRPELLAAGKADVWDSGRVETDQSRNVAYAGPALTASTRYYWRVRVWGADEKPYAASRAGWWETGLMTQVAWRADWIGYETPEEGAVRFAGAKWITNPDAAALNAENQPEQRIAFRTQVRVAKPVQRAVLYATAWSTVAAWVNGKQALRPREIPAWKSLDWKKFVTADVTAELGVGENTLAIEDIRYITDANAMPHGTTPLIATLYVEYADGTTATFNSGTDWKTAIHAAEGWERKDFDDSGWRMAAETESGGRPWIPDSVKMLRNEFAVSAPVKSARLYATALGAYELFLNGRRVSDDVMAPGWTDYREHVKYQTYDVTAMVRSGVNAVGALLAPGWYETTLSSALQPNNYGLTPPALLAELRIEHADGSVEWVKTDASWMAARSYIVHAENYDGETEDARLMQPGWDAAGFKAAGWKNAIRIEPEPTRIEAQGFAPIRVERVVAAKSVSEPRLGVFVFDMGQNLTGVERLRVAGAAGTVVRLRFAEVLNPDGTVYTENLRSAKATDSFTLSGKGTEEFVPQFTFHGFRYVEMTGVAAKPALDAVSALVLHTAAPFTAQLTTGSAMVNKLWSNILWGQRSNFVGVPTDCPQRDERLGWMADAQVFWRTASYNMDLAAFTRKYAGDMRGTQAGTPFYGVFAPGTVEETSGSGAGWSDAGVIIPWTEWLQTGDTRVIDENWAAMEKYLNAIAAANPDGLWSRKAGTAFGDWLAPEGKTEYLLIATAYWAYDVTLMREMAAATGRTADAEKYARLFEKIRAAFDQRFVRADGFVAGADDTPTEFAKLGIHDARSTDGATQTGYVLALHMNLLPEGLRAAAARKLAEKIHANHDLLGTGFLGTPYLLEELTKAGYTELAYTLLLNTEYPSWGYLVEHGATTMWERWNGDKMMDDPSMNSYNHYAYGAVADWMYRYAAGVDATPLDAGFHTVVLDPVFSARLGRVAFDYASAYGKIHSDWTYRGDGTVLWHVTIPANTRGWLPVSAREMLKYKLNGAPLNRNPLVKLEIRDGQSGCELASGSYTFEIQVEYLLMTSSS